MRMIAYDLETTRIRAGETPRPVYLTAFCDDWRLSARVDDLKHLRALLEARFLVREFDKARFVAWNGNHFDVYLIARALLDSPDLILRPYLTRSKNLRGLRVVSRSETGQRGKPLAWEFLDGISMTGLTGKKLAEFLATFAPDYAKLKGPDFEHGEDFDCANPDHIRYAERDSEGLFRGLQRAEAITLEKFGARLRPTIGNLGIRIFQSHLPADTTIWTPAFDVREIIRAQVLRGGFCHRARRHDGPIWKYDLNQAYAAAMREAKLPAGRCLHSPFRLNPYASVFIVRCEGAAPPRGARVPFYYRSMGGEAGTNAEALPETWITSLEYAQLRAEGWTLKIHESYFWDESFSMRSFVDELEQLRRDSPGGPAGAQGVMVKMIGNNAYGKTCEQLDGIELVMALKCPEGFSPYQAETDELEYIWYRFGNPQFREYHQPQLGAFITAHVRMQVRRAILKAPDAWLYADTDCVAFDRPVKLDLDPVRYGAWKCEESGTEFWIIEKKVYARKDGAWDDKHARHAKGMNVRKLGRDDFRAWFEGRPPVQVQVQRQNFVKFIGGGPMFAERRKFGQAL